MNKKKIKYRVTYLEMISKPSFDWPKNLKHKLSILLAESFPSWYFLFFYKQVGKNYYWTDWLRKSEDEIDEFVNDKNVLLYTFCLIYTSPSPRDWTISRMPSSA